MHIYLTANFVEIQSIEREIRIAIIIQNWAEEWCVSIIIAHRYEYVYKTKYGAVMIQIAQFIDRSNWLSNVFDFSIHLKRRFSSAVHHSFHVQYAIL